MCGIENGTCISLGGAQYCDVTITWQPRVSEQGGLLAVIIPILYTVVMFGLVMVRNYIKYKNDTTGERKIIGQGIMDTYKRNVSILYSKDYVNEEDYIKLSATTKTKKKRAEDLITEQCRVFYIDGQRIVKKLPDKISNDNEPVKKEVIDCETIIGENSDETGTETAEIEGARPEVFKTSVKVATRYHNFKLNGRKIKVADQIVNYKSSILEVSSEEFKTARKHRKILGCIKLPRALGMFSMVMKLILQPMLIVLWDMVDVYFDTFYFYQLETGRLIDCRITRNTRVNNSILAFAVLGAIKSTFFTMCNLAVVAYNEAESKDHVQILMISMFATSVKILFEDGPEVILEYFYVDKFITDATPPWYLVAKDIIMALFYVLPLIKMIKSGYKEYKKFCSSNDPFLDREYHVGKGVALRLYIPTILSKSMISLALMFRVIGMILQYSQGRISQQCLAVIDPGSLVQTPFTAGCMDWCVLLFTGAAIFSALLPGLLTVLVLPFAWCAG